MRRAWIAVCWAGVLACSPGGDQADTMSLAAIDTLKPDTSAGATTGATAAATVPAGTQTKAPNSPANQTKTATKTAPRDTTNIGHDRAIPIDTKDPKVRLPTVDTTKRPQG